MAENSKGGILTKADKFLRRRKTKILQSLGKTDVTKDEKLTDYSQKLDRQQEVGTKLQRDFNHYLKAARALAAASKTFYTTVTETWEAEWENQEQVNQILMNMDNLWQDYLQKLQEQVQEPLGKYLDSIPPIKARIAKRGRKLIDYDNAKHTLEVHQNAKKRDETKIAKAKDEVWLTQGIYEELNNELHEELPEFYMSRHLMYGNLFENLFSAELLFQSESGKGKKKVVDWSDRLVEMNRDNTYTPRKNVRSTILSKRRLERGDNYSYLFPPFNRLSVSRNDSNGHHENGADSQPGSPSTSPTSTEAAGGLTNGTAESDEGTKSDEPYENAVFSDANIVDLSVDPSTTTKPSDTAAPAPVPAEPSPSTVVKDEAPPVKPAEDQKAEVPKVEETMKPEPKEEEEEPKVNGTLDTSTEPEEPETESPPPPPASPPPEDIAPPQEVKKEPEPVQDDLYQVPPPAKPVDDDTPEKYLYMVQATHAYKGEDDDELSFDSHEVIYVLEYDDPEEQKLIEKKKTEKDPGWLMGMRKLDRKIGVFPENFTKRV